MSCASELKPYINNNEDQWKKIRVPKYQKPLTWYHAIIFHMCILFWGFFGIMTIIFFSPILVIISIRRKFQSTAHLECFKYPYWDMPFLAQILLFRMHQGQFQYLKCHFFTNPHHTYIIIIIRLKFQFYPNKAFPLGATSIDKIGEVRLSDLIGEGGWNSEKNELYN